MEVIEISINPETLEYYLDCKNAYLEDIYLVLKTIIFSLEEGDLQGVFELINSKGEQADRKQIKAVIGGLKEKLENAELPQYLVRDFRN